MAVHSGSRQDEDAGLQAIAKDCQPGNRAIVQAVHGKFSGLGETHDASYVFGSCAAAALVANAHPQRPNRGSAAHKHGAHALETVHFVGADREQVASKTTHVTLDLARTLHRIDVKDDTGL